MGFSYNEDNAHLSSTHVKDIAHHSTMKLGLSYQNALQEHFQVSK